MSHELDAHKSKDARSLKHKLHDAAVKHQAKKHKQIHRKIDLHGKKHKGKKLPGISQAESDFIHLYNKGMLEHERKKRIQIGEVFEVVGEGMNKFSFTFTEAARKLLDGIAHHMPKGVSHGSGHASSDEYPKPWLLKYLVEENLAEAQRHHG